MAVVYVRLNKMPKKWLHLPLTDFQVIQIRELIQIFVDRIRSALKYTCIVFHYLYCIVVKPFRV